MGPPNFNLMKYSSIAIPFIVIAALACNNYCSTADNSATQATTDSVKVDSTSVPVDSIAIDTTAK